MRIKSDGGKMKKIVPVFCGSMILVSSIASAAVQCKLNIKSLSADNKLKVYYDAGPTTEVTVAGKTFDIACNNAEASSLNCVADFAVDMAENLENSYQVYVTSDVKDTSIHLDHFRDDIIYGTVRNESHFPTALFNRSVPFTYGTTVEGKNPFKIEVTCSKQD
jgi:hypothetical protein